MYRYEATITESTGRTVRPSITTPDPMSEGEIINFFGLNLPDVINYSIRTITV